MKLLKNFNLKICSRVQFLSTMDKSATSFKNIPLILDDDKPPERPSRRNLKKEPAEKETKNVSDNHYLYMFIGKAFLKMLILIN